MALNKEDKADVSRSMGKALANKVSKVTKDRMIKRSGIEPLNRDAVKYQQGKGTVKSAYLARHGKYGSDKTQPSLGYKGKM